ncbi:MAG: LytR family transcriptional regulator [Clostridiales bacterium]|nr:LytR family transcriptional regulator [Clostridiales bacterium]
MNSVNMKRSRAYKTKHGKKRRKIIFIILAVILCITAVAGVLVYKHFQNPWGNGGIPTPPANTSTPTPELTPEITPTPSIGTTPEATPVVTPTPLEPTPTPTPEIYDFSKDGQIINILLLGYDKNEKREDRYSVFRTDTIMLCTIYLESQKINLTSIPRDTYVYIGPEFTRKDKINSCPAWADAKGHDVYEVLTATVSKLFGGIEIPYYVAIDMDCFVSIIDAMGGIDFDVDVNVWHEDGRLLVPKGFQHLNGKQALDYVRFRRTALGDVDRTYRQRRFLTAVFTELKSTQKLSSLINIYKIVRKNVDTNLNLAQITSLVSIGLNTNIEDLNNRIVKGFFLNKNGISYWGVDQAERVKMIKELFGITVEQEPTDKAS